MDESTPAEGAYGNAILLDCPDVPEASETVCSWLITSPYWHPAWSQYLLFVVRLRDNVPGFPAPRRQFPGATHELLVVALNPTDGPFGPDFMHRYKDGGMPYLTPVNIAHQIEGTDDEASELAMLAAKGVVHGFLKPETGNGPDRIRAAWKSSLTRSLAHIRGEVHAP